MATILYFSYAIALIWILYKWLNINKLHNTPIFKKTKEMDDKELEEAESICAMLIILIAIAAAVIGILCAELSNKDWIIRQQKMEIHQLKEKHTENSSEKYLRTEYIKRFIHQNYNKQ